LIRPGWHEDGRGFNADQGAFVVTSRDHQENVMNSEHVTVIASCDDLLLAQECIADLRCAGCSDVVSIVSTVSIPESDAAGFAFGRRTGEVSGRRILFGFVSGVIAGQLALAPTDPMSSAGIFAGGLIGAAVGLLSYGLRKSFAVDAGQSAGLILRCATNSDAAKLVAKTLETSACRDVRLVS
jgi:hypothetical protein